MLNIYPNTIRCQIPLLTIVRFCIYSLKNILYISEDAANLFIINNATFYEFYSFKNIKNMADILMVKST